MGPQACNSLDTPGRLFAVYFAYIPALASNEPKVIFPCDARHLGYPLIDITCDTTLV